MSLLPWGLALALQAFAASRPEGVDRVYTNGAYPIIASTIARASDWTSFPIAEALGTLAFVSLLVAAAFGLRLLIRRRGERLYACATGLRRFAAVSGWLYLLFLLSWGLNHHRPPFAALAGYSDAESTPEELIALNRALLSRVNALRSEFEPDPEKLAGLMPDRGSAYERATLSYRDPAVGIPAPPIELSAAKGMNLSFAMSLLGLGGVFSPFTSESMVNASMPAIQRPFTAAHELAHRLGFAREDEANYAAYLMCRSHPDVDFRYSGALTAFRYAAGTLKHVDRDAWEKLMTGLAPGAARDQQAITEYWACWTTFVRTIGTAINDLYLKSQGQGDGVASYGRMVDLMIAERRRE